MQHVKGIDALGLVVKNDKQLKALLNYFDTSQTKFLYSEIRVPILTQPEIFDSKLSFFITGWQDQHESNKLTFDGIVDRKGRYKTDYFELLNALQNSKVKIESPVVRILKPATLIVEGKRLGYYAMCYDSIQGWKHGAIKGDLSFEWSMIKCDIHGNYLAIKDIGVGDTISISIPRDNDQYRLLLTTFKGEAITTTITELNTPFLQKKDINE
jgi:hypothetical protein